jgi:hypothetical protein
VTRIKVKILFFKERGIMETSSNKKINPVDYEGDMARLCQKLGPRMTILSLYKVVAHRTTDLGDLGRQGYSEEGYNDIKIPILNGKGVHNNDV